MERSLRSTWGKLWKMHHQAKDILMFFAAPSVKKLKGTSVIQGEKEEKNEAPKSPKPDV